MFRWLLICSCLIFTVCMTDAANAAPKKKRVATASAPAAASDDEEDGPSTVGKARDKALEKALEKGCKALLLMDARTGEVLFEQNSHERLRPASMVKLMVVYVIQKKIDDGELTGEEVVTASARSAKIGGSQVYLKEGEQFTIKELLEAVIVQSANDAAVALAEHLAGSSEAFVDLMNEAAQDLGMKESEFHFPHGLPPSAGQLPDLVSAHDFAILSRALVNQHPKVLEFTGKLEAPFRGGTFVMRNHNKLISSYAGCDGLKTGYYSEAGFNVSTTATKNGERMIAVVMGCGDRRFRDAEAARLLSKGFAQFKNVRLVKKGETLQGRIAIEGGERPDVQAIAAEDVRAPLRSSEEEKVVQKASFCSSLKAPVSLGTPCGTVSFFVGDKEVAKVNAVVGEELAPATGFRKLMNYFGR